MSYADDACATRFSHEQVMAMRANYNTLRSGYLLNAAQNFAPVAGITTIISPESGASHPADYVPISWTKVPGADKYGVAIYKVGNTTNQLWSRVTTDTFTSVLAKDSLLPGASYILKIVAFNSGHPGNTWSANLQFSTSDALGINSISNNATFKIYPNPVNNYFIVNFISDNSSVYNLSVRDLAGREVYTKQINGSINSEVVETSNWASGEYFVQLKNNQNQIIKSGKVVVSK
jgi:hypothetical protein